jgi:hypothetical protein|tara:strand:+ start:692 stop:1126 length:435 start_codon:yes stop_codon:yes gene_type:complete
MNDICRNTWINPVLPHKSITIKISMKTVNMFTIFKYFTCLIIVLCSCYPAPKVTGFDQDQWELDLIECDNYRATQGAPLLINQKEIVLGSNQNEIIALLGSPTKQRLDKRNRKFFFYQLNCENTIELSIRFNAIGAAKEIMMVN